MKIYHLIFLFSLIIPFATCCSSNDFDIIQKDSQNSFQSEYSEALKSAQDKNELILNTITQNCSMQRSSNPNVIDYLISLPKEKLDSLIEKYSCYSKYEDMFDEFLVLGIETIIDSIGENGYISYLDYFENHYNYSNPEVLEDFLKDKSRFEQSLYIQTAANLNTNSIDFSDTRNAVINTRESYCRNLFIMQCMKSTLEDSITDVVLSTIPIEIDPLVALGFGLVEAAKLVEDYHNCLHGK